MYGVSTCVSTSVAPEVPVPVLVAWKFWDFLVPVTARFAVPAQY